MTYRAQRFEWGTPEHEADIGDVPPGYWERLTEAMKRMKPLPPEPAYDAKRALRA